ncbi:10056_t:CDS:2, partial [Entrophospora sp. SA101]
MYMVDGKIQTCGCSQQTRPLNHLIGMWQLDREIVKKTEEEGKKLGTCMQHFNVDQKYHKNKLKTTISVIVENVIKKRSRHVTTLEAKNTLLLLIQLIQQGEEISEEKFLTILPTLNMKADSSNTWMLIESRIIYHEIAPIK